MHEQDSLTNRSHEGNRFFLSFLAQFDNSRDGGEDVCSKGLTKNGTDTATSMVDITSAGGIEVMKFHQVAK